MLIATQALAQQELSREGGEANIRGARLRLNGDYQGALQEFEQVIRLDPNSHLGWYNRGMVRRDLGDCRSAVDDFSRALKLDPDYFGALYHRGNCRQALGEFRDAIADYTRAVELPGRVDGRFLAYFGRGDARRRSGDLAGALADYSRVAETRTDTTALRSRAWVNLYLGRWQGAFEDAARFLRGGEGKEPGSGYAALVGYIALRRLGDRPKADAFLAEWGKRTGITAWPAPVFGFFEARTGEPALLAAARTPAERLEAECYAGIAHLLAGERTQGVKALKNVLLHGDPQYWEVDLAYYELRRLGEAAEAPRRAKQ
jgi:tetratricopeptide (TPR) repeat protein